MSRSSHRLVALAAFAAATALAAPVSADKYLFSGTHTIRFSHNGVIKEVSKSGTGVAVVNRAGSDIKLNTLELTRPFAAITATVMGNELGTMGTAPITEIDEVRFKGVRIDPGRAGLNGLPGPPVVFAPIFGAASGMGKLTQSTLPAAGTIRLCVVAGCATGGTLQVNLVQKETTSPGPMTYAIGPGVGGTFTATGMSGTQVTVIGKPWTINAAQASYKKPGVGTVMLTSMGFAKGPDGKAGTTLVGMGGMVQLVTPIQTKCAGACGSVNSPAAQISRLTLTFEPEPGRLALLGAGAALLALLGRTRARH